MDLEFYLLIWMRISDDHALVVAFHVVDRLGLAIFVYASLFFFDMYPEYGLFLMCDI